MLTTANVWVAVFVHLGIILAAVSYFAVGAAMLPNITRRGAERLAERPVRTVLTGVAVSVPWVAASIVLLQLGGPLASLGALVGLTWILLGLLGGAAVAQHVGQRGEGWQRVARGGGLIALTWVLPLIGWFFMLPLTLATGIACLIVGWRTRVTTGPNTELISEPPFHAFPS
jgi:hypothetical protein